MAQREAAGSGPSLLVCLYSAGLNRAQAERMFAPFLSAAAAAGLPDSRMLDHYTTEEYAHCSSYEQYVSSLLAPIRQTGRPVILVAHSHGAVAAHGLALRLGRRLRLLAVLGRRPPTEPLLPDVFGVQTSGEIADLSLSAVVKALADAYASRYYKVRLT